MANKHRLLTSRPCKRASQAEATKMKIYLAGAIGPSLPFVIVTILKRYKVLNVLFPKLGSFFRVVIIPFAIFS